MRANVVICSITRRITRREDLVIVTTIVDGEEEIAQQGLTRAEAAQWIKGNRRVSRRAGERARYWVW